MNRHRSCFATDCDLDHVAIDRELHDNPIGPHRLAPNELWAYGLIHDVITRHSFHDHDCQTTGCKAMFIYNSDEFTRIMADAYERGRRDAAGVAVTEKDQE